MLRMRALLLLRAVALALLCCAGVDAKATATHKPKLKAGAGITPLTQNLSQGNMGWNTGGPGVFLAGSPGGYYLGRMMPGEHAQSDRHVSNYVGDYYLVRYNGFCAWLGPPTVPKSGPGSGPPFTHYATLGKESTRTRAQCTAATKRLYTNSFVHKPNCGPSRASFGSRTTLKRATTFYYNIKWNAEYTGASMGFHSLNLAASNPVHYRFQTADGKWAVIYAEGAGWGFVNTADINWQAAIGKWNRGPMAPAEKCTPKGKFRTTKK